MEGSITKKSVMIECVEILRQELAIFSKHYDGLEPKEGMEEAWEQGRRKLELAKNICQSLDSEIVQEAMAVWQMEQEQQAGTKGRILDWQREIMERGPREAMRFTEEG